MGKKFSAQGTRAGGVATYKPGLGHNELHLLKKASVKPRPHHIADHHQPTWGALSGGLWDVEKCREEQMDGLGRYEEPRQGKK